MTTHPPPAEYDTVIRLDNAYPSPPSHDLVADTEPLHVRQFCRIMTLAQGRVLYDVWERIGWQERRVGYLVPSHVVFEARKISGREVAQHWRDLPPVKARQYESAWKAVVGSWPRMQVFGVRRVVERLVRLGLGDRLLVVEDAVVRYARRNWTSYWLRMSAGRGNEFGLEERVCEAVAERLRGVLMDWMEADVSLQHVQSVFERHGLAEVREKNVQETRHCARFS